MNGASYLAPIRGVAAKGGRVVGGMHAGHIAIFVCVITGAGHQVGLVQPYLVARVQTAVFLDGLGHKVVPLNVQLPAKGHGALAVFRVVRVVFHFQGLGLVLRVVVDHQLNGVQYRHGSGSGGVQVLPYAGLQQGKVHHAVRLGYADALAEVPYRLRRIAPAAHTAEGGHTGIIPAADNAVLHQL